MSARAGTARAKSASRDVSEAARPNDGVVLDVATVDSFRLADPEQARWAFAQSIALGLSSTPRRLSCRYLYDERGSELFDRITLQPEYYLTDAEAALLRKHAADVRALTGPTNLLELGSGTSTKTRHLLDAWAAACSGGDRPAYVAVDICPEVVTQSCATLAREYAALDVRGIVGSYEQAMTHLRAFSPLTLAFLGSTIGNLDEPELEAFLARIAAGLPAGDHFLLGFDLVKDIATLEAAYNDGAGVSADFTRNLFARMNRELGTGLDLEQIEHVAYYSIDRERIEIFARFRRETTIRLFGFAQDFRIAAGEMVQTEISRKFQVDEVAERLARHGLVPIESFVGTDEGFALVLARRDDTTDGEGELRRVLLRDLDDARARTCALVYSLEDDQLTRQHDPLQSPIVWDLAHIANFEEQWVCRVAPPAHVDPDRPRRDDLYDAMAHPRSVRVRLALPDRATCLDEMARVRRHTRASLGRVALDGDDPLVHEGYLYAMLAEHEAQHGETILQTLQLIDGLRYEPHLRRPPRVAERRPPAGMATVPAGSFPIGTDERRVAYDNERPRHDVDLPAFRIDFAPVSNAEYATFVDDGGYRRRELWCDAGWDWLREARVAHPAQWRRTRDGGWDEVAFGRREPLDPRRAVVHVSWYEADAYARWAGKRLPTELEWEKAAACDLERGVTRLHPWGDGPPTEALANLDQRSFAPSQIGAHPEGRSYFGCEQMLGCVWEWTSSDFAPYPGFRAFPYREYSEAHFGKGYKVLRGGSWATRPIAIRNTFRNWDLPQRRQIFAGLRCAADA